jgi:hypothetical protein
MRRIRTGALCGYFYSDVDTLRGNISEIGPLAFFFDTSEFRR